MKKVTLRIRFASQSPSHGRKKWCHREVYRVHSKNFKKVVQRLTGALDQPSEPKRLKSLAPPPIETSSTVAQTEEISSSSAYLLSSSPLANFWREICNDLNDLGKEAQVVAAKTTTNKINSAAVPSVPYSSGLRLPSPCTLNATWPPSFMFLSPGTMASFEDATTVGTFSAILVQIDANRLPIEGLVLGVLFCVRLAANYLQQAFLWRAALQSAYEIRVYVFDRVLERDLGFFERGGVGVCSGDVAYRITAEGSDVADTVHALLNSIPPTCLIIAYLGERLRRISKKAHISVAKLSAHLNEILLSMLLVKANNTELCEGVRFRRLALADLSANFNKKKMKALIPQIVKTIYVGAVLTFCAGSLIICRGSSNGSNIVSFVTSLFLLIEPIQDVGKAYNELKQGEPAIDRLFDLTSFSSQIIEEPNAVHPVSVMGDVKFRDISFGYGQNMPLVLGGLNLHIKSGETVALIGPSGGGKTTLTKLLLRLYDPLRGSVLIDDVDIRNIQLKSLRKHVGLVSQDVALLSGTIAENVGYQDLIRGIDLVRVEHAAKAANADEFIKALPRGYDTDIGQRGTILSGGQKQRQELNSSHPFIFCSFAIARAIYQNPSILILDEATSALDSKSELLVRQALERLMRNRTVLFVAHRIETIIMADRIVILENGKLQEITRTSLLNGSNCYRLLPSD
ncbi:hypothetical protein Sjap_001140 [Stephania japonica]|uniref:ABC transporter B family member 29, chloroplastic n=1 Tax=Stephania japonica TaxID=461633 RepID=A0AAP0KLY0_9MAGN